MSRRLGTLTVTEEVGVAREAEIVVAGLRVTPAHTPDGPLAIAVRDGSGWQPAQVLAQRDGDGAVDWLALAFPANVAATGTLQLEVHALDADDAAPADASGRRVQVSTTDAGVELSWCGTRAAFAAGEFLVLPGELLAGGAIMTADLDGQAATGVVDLVEVVHGGPLLVELRLVGRLVARSGPVASWHATVRAAASSPALQLAVALVAGGPGDTELTSWQVALRTPEVVRAIVGTFEQGASAVPPLAFGHAGGGHPRGIFAVSSVSGGEDWRDANEAGYDAQWEWAELHGPVAQNWVVTQHGGIERTVAVERLCEHYPARVDCEAHGTVVQFFDGTAGGAVLTRGSAPRRTLAVVAAADRRAGARLDHPLVGFQADALSAVRPDVLPHLPDLLPNLESLIRAELFGWYLAGQSLGFYDHGDGMQAIPAGPRVGYSSNNEHDALYALLLHYLRSGERAYLDSARAYGDHLVDIDQIHSTDYPHEAGGLRAHGRAHVHYVDARTPTGLVRTSVDTGHMWVEGLVLLTEVTGERRYLDAAVAVGDCLLRLETLGWTRPEPGPRNAGWPLIALAGLGRATGEQRFLDAAERIARLAVSRQEDDGRWLMRLGFLRDYCAWQNAVLIVGLSRTADVLDVPDLRVAVERAGRGMLDGGRTPEGTFIYLGRYDYRWPQRSGLVREALACLYDATKDPEYLTAGLLGGARWYPVQGRPRVTSEEIAEWRGHLPFLGFAHTAGLLEDLP